MDRTESLFYSEVQHYIDRIQADAYFVEQALSKPLNEVEFVRVINRLANISYLASQAISDLTLEAEE